MPARWSALVWLSLLLAGTLQLAGARPNVLLIVSEDNGPELGCYGDPYAHTPNLDALARTGVRFQNAFVPYSVCSPSRACFLTGLYPHQHGHVGLATHKFAMFKKWPNLPSLLQTIGYRTGLIGKLHVNPADAFPFDFKRYNGSNFNRRNIREFAAAARAFFEQDSTPFFLSINYPDAHFPLLRDQFGSPKVKHRPDEVKPLPWIAADSPRLRTFTADYYNCIARLDEGVGLLLEALEQSGKLETTLIIYIGDHGAQFSRGKATLYEAGLRIPMILSWPGHMLHGHEPTQLVSSLDLLPTVLAATGIEPPGKLPGIPLQAMLKGEPAPGHRVIASLNTGSAPGLLVMQFGIRDEWWKLIHNPFREPNICAQKYLTQGNAHFAAGTRPDEIHDGNRAVYERFLHPPVYELYDLKSDPHEFENLANLPAHQETLARMQGLLRDWQTRWKDPFANPEKLRQYHDEQVRQQSGAYRKQKDFRWKYLDVLAPEE